jgi:hypothetical protein
LRRSAKRRSQPRQHSRRQRRTGRREQLPPTPPPEAERLRRLAEEESNKPKRRVAGFDLVMKEQSGSHAYDHENAELVERRREADAAQEAYDRMKEDEERRSKGFIVPEEDGERQQ